MSLCIWIALWVASGYILGSLFAFLDWCTEYPLTRKMIIGDYLGAYISTGILIVLYSIIF